MNKLNFILYKLFRRLENHYANKLNIVLGTAGEDMKAGDCVHIDNSKFYRS